MIINPYSFAAVGGGYDSDAQAWFDAVEAVSSITTANKDVVNTFVAGCKTDGIWTAIEVCCLLCAADDITGALVPLVGPTPTNTNFVNTDYSRTAGIANRTGCSINTNQDTSSLPQNSMSYSVWLTSRSADYVLLINDSSGSGLYAETPFIYFRNRNNNLASGSNKTNDVGFLGSSRGSSAGFDVSVSGTKYSLTQDSASVASNNFVLFGNNGSNGVYSMAFYHLGSHLDLDLLEARVTTLLADLT